MNREKKLIKNTIILGIGNIIPKLSSFIVLPILTGYLTKSEYGTYDLIVVLSSLLLPAVTLQLQTAAFRFLIDKMDDKEKQKSIITNIFLFLNIVCFITIFIMFFVLHKIPIITRLLILSYFIFEVLYSTVGQTARGLCNSKIYAFAAGTNSIVNLIFTIILVYFFKWGINGVLICLCLADLIPILIITIKLKLLKYINIKLFDKKLLKEMLKYSWPMVPNGLSMWVINASDRIVITMFLGIEQNAIYAVAKKIPNMLTIVQSTFTMAWTESASIASKDTDSSEYYSKMFDLVFSFMSSMMVLVIAIMPILFLILIRGDYGDAYSHMPILTLSMFFYSIASYLGGIYVAEMKTKNVGITTVVSAIVNLVTCLLMVKFVGLYAASISTLISYIVLSSYRMFNIKKYTNINYNYKKLIIMLIFMIGISLLSYINNIYFRIGLFIVAVFYTIIINRKIIMIILKKILKWRCSKNEKI